MLKLYLIPSFYTNYTNRIKCIFTKRTENDIFVSHEVFFSRTAISGFNR